MTRYFLIFHGRVQGVGFRYFAQSNALKYSITGFVKNEYDGTVSMEAQGQDIDLHNFLQTLSKGNMFIRVDNIIKENISIVENETKFKVKY
ncbi:acylphosphatase [uncultured Clostridium sp.]|uniref:acylphosphatase n=1 Tax=uncultured Clostridium sp. TaxID=59620 RepID=UPI0025E595A4|nr:acylphosphatase [uncultured Clostridium sp.]